MRGAPNQSVTVGDATIKLCAVKGGFIVYRLDSDGLVCDGSRVMCETDAMRTFDEQVTFERQQFEMDANAAL